MSGIYIPGLKDLSCDNCFWGIGSRLGCHATPEAVTRKINGRAADCPLIFLGDHGRLIDADEADNRYVADFTELNDFQCGWNAAMMRVCDAAPTVIPADKETEK